jgi:flagellar FliL protein
MAQIDLEEEGEEKPSKKPLIILIAAVLVSLGVGAGGTFFVMQKKLENQEPVECVEPPPPPITTVYHEIEKPLIVNFAQSTSAKLIKITLAFSADGPEVMAALKKNEPMIVNNLLMLISAQTVDSLKTHDGKVALRNAVFDDVTAILEKVAPGAEIKEVYFTSFIMQ